LLKLAPAQAPPDRAVARRRAAVVSWGKKRIKGGADGGMEPSRRGTRSMAMAGIATPIDPKTDTIKNKQI